MEGLAILVRHAMSAYCDGNGSRSPRSTWARRHQQIGETRPDTAPSLHLVLDGGRLVTADVQLVPVRRRDRPLPCPARPSLSLGSLWRRQSSTLQWSSISAVPTSVPAASSSAPDLGVLEPDCCNDLQEVVYLTHLGASTCCL